MMNALLNRYTKTTFVLFLMFLSFQGWGQSITEGFEGTFPPSGWVNSGCIQSSNNPKNGTKDLGFNAANDAIISPTMTNPGTLSFWYRRSSNSAAWGLKIEVLNSSNTVIATLTAISSATTTYQQYTADLSSYNDVKIKLTDTRSSGTHERYVDDFSVTHLSSTYTVTYDGNGSDGGTAPSDAGSPYASGATVTVLGNTGSLTKTGYNFNNWNTAADGSGTAYAPSATFTINANTILYAQWAPPTLSTTSSLSSFSTSAGVASASQSYTVSGDYLTASATVTAPTDFEVSTDNTTFSASVTLTQTGGNLDGEPVTVYVRIAASASAGSVSGNISHASSGATTVNVAVSGSVTAAEPTNHPSGFAATANGSEQITVTWADNDGAQAASGFLILANTTGTFTDPVDGTAQSDDALVKNINHGVETATFSGLSSATTYYFKIFAYNGSGSSINYKIAGAPTANAATNAALGTPTATAGTSITSSSFQANWNAVSGATGYKLDVYTSSSTPTSNDFGFEGSTSLPTNWTGNGYVTNNSTNSHNGTYYAGLNAETKYIRTNIISNPTSVSFYYRSSATSADYTVKCQTSTDGTTWSDVGTYVTIGSGASTTYVSDNITLNLTGDYYIQWIMTARSGGSFYFDDVTINKNIVNLTYVSGYENLTVAGTSQSVSGLDPNTEYSYRVRATDASATTANSNVISVTTLAPTPTATAASNIVSRSFQANWNSVATADAYIVELSTNSGFSSIDNLYENFGACITSNGVDISAALNSHTHYTGWTGTSVFEDFGFVRINNGGHLQTPTIDLTGNSGSHTLSFKAAYSGSAATLRVLLSTDGTNFSALGGDISLTSAFTSYTRSITGGTATSIVKFLVVSGDLLLDEVDISDFSETTTSTSLTFYGLNSNTTYYYRVRTVVDGVESANSGSITAATYQVPLTPASNFDVTEPNATTFHLTWTDGNGAGRLIKINNQNSFTQPTDFGTETANTTWQNGGEQVVYVGDGVTALDITLPGSSTLNITNLHLAFFEYQEHNFAKAVKNAYGIGQVYKENGGWFSQLPIELLSFEGAIMKGYNQIQWTTASETNNHFFTLQKSLDNRQFEDLTRVEGSGNSNEIRNYSYNDFDQNDDGVIYYRLQQTDFDGSSTYSNVIALNHAISNDLRYWIGDNNQLNLSFDQASSNSQIELYSMDGKRIFTTSMEENGSSEAAQIQLPASLHGIYLIKVIHDSQLSNGKLFIP